MRMAFTQLFLANVRMLYRNTSGLFWTIAMPLVFFVIFALFRLERYINVGGSSYADFFLPGFLAYTFMQGGLYGLGYFLTDLKAKGVIKRFLVTPIKPFELALALVASRLVVMVGQLVMLTVVGVFIFQTRFSVTHFPAIILVTIVGGALFLLLGLLISTVADSYESAAPLTAGIGLPLMFLGDIFYPISMLPSFLEALGRILPLSHLSQSLRMLFAGSVDWGSLAVHLLVILAWFALMLILIRWRFRLEE